MSTSDQLLQSARAQHAAGQLHAAANLYQQVLSTNGNDFDATAGLAGIALQTRNFAAAIALFSRALQIVPSSVDAMNNLGVAYAQVGKSNEAIDLWQRVATAHPSYPDVFVNLTNMYRKLGRLSDAVAAGRRALALAPNHAEARSNLGNVLSSQGRVDEAIVELRQALAIKPNAMRIHSNLLMNLQYSDAVAPQDVFDEHVRWARQHAEPLTVRAARAPYANDRNPDRRLRIGYVSADLREHPISHFIDPLLSAHDRARVEVHCFADVHRRDAVTDRLQSLCEHWHEITNQSADRVATLVREKQIDVLVDLAVHTSNHRLLVFARRPAPVQVTYLGYAATTGMSAIDWRLTDVHVDPPTGATERFHSEKLYRLPRTQWCYNPRDLGGDVGPSPALTNGCITFGSFNKLNKITPTVLRLWQEILTRLPTARLIIKSRGLDDEPTRRRVIDALNVDDSRLRLVGWSDLPTYLTLFNEVDVALDSYPFAGGTTSCNAAWMGVPIITLAGETSISRVGASILNTLGLPERIARSEAEYIELAVRDAEQVQRLAELRATMRQRMKSSPLMDAQAFARDVEAAYRQMWRNYCDHDPG